MSCALPRSIVATTVKQGSVYLVNQQSFLDNSKPHFFVVLNKDPNKDVDKWHLVNATSNVADRIQYRKIQSWPKSTLVIVNREDCSFLSSRSVFDCNCILSISAKTFLNWCDESKDFHHRGIISKKVLDKILLGVKDSKNVDDRVKNRL